MRHQPTKMILSIVLSLVLVLSPVMLSGCGKDLTATTMRMLKQQGIVKLYDRDQKEISIKENLRLNSGNSLKTEVESLAGVALDDTKMVTIDELTNIIVNQDGKKLAIDLTEGSLFFEVTEKLDADASFDIRTSTMVVGIRGTSGLVTTNENGENVLVITDGSAEATAVDLGTGETVSVICEAGHSVTARVVNSANGEVVTFEEAKVQPADLKPFAVAIIADSERLMEVVPEATGWTQEEINEANQNAGNSSGNSGQTGEEQTDTASAGSSEEESNTDSATGASTEEKTDESAEASSTASSVVETASSTSSSTMSKLAERAAALGVSEGVLAQIAETDGNGIMTLVDGDTFDPVLYLQTYPDLQDKIGNNPYTLLEHYLTYGKKESRTASTDSASAETSKVTKTKEQELAELQAWEETLARAEADAAAKKAEEDRIQWESQNPDAGDGNNDSGNSGPDLTGYELMDDGRYYNPETNMIYDPATGQFTPMD